MVNFDKLMAGINQTWYINGSECHIVDNVEGVAILDLSDLIDDALENDKMVQQLHTEDPLYRMIMNNVSEFGPGEVLNELFNEYCKKFGRTSLDMLCDHINAYCQSRPWPYNLYGVMNPYSDEYSGF